MFAQGLTAWAFFYANWYFLFLGLLHRFVIVAGVQPIEIEALLMLEYCTPLAMTCFLSSGLCILLQAFFIVIKSHSGLGSTSHSFFMFLDLFIY